ncbi:MAG: hypothetical protein LQ343_002504 [Gyalolechia ehrenbergii]|nr:MAG: hypothetical protein LQ343_002504 [Gyalolechia ehrenbergii]
MDYEVTALQTIGALLSPRGIGTGNEGAGKGCSETSAVAVKLPKLLDYDAEVKVLMMSDGGLRTLKDAYADMGGEEIRECGRMLGNWLARLHYLTRETDIGEWGNPIGKSMYRWAYSRLHEVAEEYGLDVEFAKYIDRKFGALLATDDECVCHGDFWPGNVLLDEDGNNENERKEGGLTVVDWEMCRRGCGATDVGQFAAETWLVDRFSGGKELQGAFLRGYREVKEGEKTANRGEFLRRVAVHMGVHLAYWPARVEWAGEEETRVVVALGHELIRKGNEGDFEWLGREWLGGLVGR